MSMYFIYRALLLSSTTFGKFSRHIRKKISEFLVAHILYACVKKQLTDALNLIFLLFFIGPNSKTKPKTQTPIEQP